MEHGNGKYLLQIFANPVFQRKRGHLPWIDPTGDKGILAAAHVLSSMTNGYQWQCQEMVPEIAIDSID
jgi:hypothetical protein